MTPLTAFLVAMLKADRASLVKADAGRLAAKYGIRADWARWYIAQQVGA